MSKQVDIGIRSRLAAICSGESISEFTASVNAFANGEITSHRQVELWLAGASDIPFYFVLHASIAYNIRLHWLLFGEGPHDTGLPKALPGNNEIGLAADRLRSLAKGKISTGKFRSLVGFPLGKIEQSLLSNSKRLTAVRVKRLLGEIRVDADSIFVRKGYISDSESDNQSKSAVSSSEPISLYFSSSEFSPYDIADMIETLSALYNEIGGDRLVIDSVEILDPMCVGVPL